LQKTITASLSALKPIKAAIAHVIAVLRGLFTQNLLARPFDETHSIGKQQ